jgi:hypothetical protein
MKRALRYYFGYAAAATRFMKEARGKALRPLGGNRVGFQKTPFLKEAQEDALSERSSGGRPF